ncbi:MAG TPA: hypothetical protein VI756_01495 [Blastocatellia bacterium]
MTHDELERAIEFVLAQQAKSNSETETLKATVSKLAETVTELSTTAKAVIEEMREGFNNLIVANEVTRDLANKTAELAV